MKEVNNVPMLSTEISGLWAAYMSDSMAVCVLRYFLNTVEDKAVRPHLQYALDLSRQHLQDITDFYNSEGIPVPQGFNDADINLNAPRLYSDSFMLFYLAVMCRGGMSAYTVCLNNAARTDIRNFLSLSLKTTIDMYNNIATSLMEMGNFIKAPVVEVPKEISFVKKESFFNGILSEPRRILTTEILQLFNNLLIDMMTKTLVNGFGQVTSSKVVREHMFKKADTLTEHIEHLSQVLSNDNVPVPSSSDIGLTDSTIPPFSDKLMMFHATTVLGSMVIAGYGVALGGSFRNDLIADYTRFIAEISKHAKEGVDIMIDNGWMEQPPQAVDHRKVAKV